MDDITLIKEKINIVDLIAEYLPLKKSGANYKANCPFHQEGTPSFMVSPERGIWHCFGCNKGGDHFKFIMEKEGVDFKEALEVLAAKAGVVLQKRPEQKDSRDRLYEANHKASQYFQYLLLEHQVGAKALEYLKNRGLTEETIKTFGLGYAPQSWETLTKFLKKRGFKTAEIIESGLGVESKNGCYDRFRGRIMFPLVDVKKRVIGFSGRILGAGEPKYVNTPQTPIFDKSKMLFGFHLSKGAIREKKTAILVEGQMDMIMSFQSEVKNVVATGGTAWTADQIEALKKADVETVSLCFDRDLAGDVAIRRGIEMADQAGFNINVIEIKEGKDPAELCQKNPRKWQEVAQKTIPIYDYYLTSAAARFNPKKSEGKRAIARELLPIWKAISNSFVKDEYIRKLAALLLVNESLIRQELSKPAEYRAEIKMAKVEADPKIELKDRRQLLEEYLLTLLLHIPKSSTYVPNFPESLLTQEELKQIYIMLVLFLDSIAFKGKSFKISEFTKTLPETLIPRVDQLYLLDLDERLTQTDHWQKEIDGVVTELKKMLIKTSLEKLALEIKNAQEFEKGEQLSSLSKKFKDLSVKLRSL